MRKSPRVWLAGVALLLLPQHLAHQDRVRPMPPSRMTQEEAAPPAVEPPSSLGWLPEIFRPTPPSERSLRRADFADERPSPDARHLADWVLDSGDHQGRPFAIIDKTEARVFVFGPEGDLQGAAPALLGLAPGDDSVPGIGERPIAQIQPHERTTPAGRFVAEEGRNSHGEDIVWVDYDNAISMHRIRPVDPRERRLQRLASPSPLDNRISYGCINLPPEFFDGVLKPLVGARRGIVYVLPEIRAVRDVFGSYDVGGPPWRESRARP